MKEIKNFDYREVFKNNLIESLKISEQQIKNGEVQDGDEVLEIMRQKYDY